MEERVLLLSNCGFLNNKYNRYNNHGGGIISNHKKTGIEEAMDDIRHGRVTEYKNADDMFDELGI